MEVIVPIFIDDITDAQKGSDLPSITVNLDSPSTSTKVSWVLLFTLWPQQSLGTRQARGTRCLDPHSCTFFWRLGEGRGLQRLYPSPPPIQALTTSGPAGNKWHP